jgi:hypothetical protein
MFLTLEQVEAMTYKECQKHMKLIAKTYNLEQPLTECWEQVWPVLDELTDTILYLEDRIVKYEDPRITSMDMTS